ncbi:MAG: hypothetical protein Q9219_004580 [cf. Caloplaca sp. 3 TL-2023]
MVVLDYVYFTTCFSAFTDVLLAVVPMVAFCRLKLKRKAKIVLVLLFSTTTIAAACALVCVAYVPKEDTFKDFTYSSITYTIWVVIEGNAIIIAACIPGLRPFVKYLRGRTRRKRLPKPLIINKQINVTSDTSALSSPISPRRMEPRISGSVSHSLHPPIRWEYRKESLARIESEGVDLERRGLDLHEEELEEGREVAHIGMIEEHAQIVFRRTL